MDKPWAVYILECGDGTYYTGISHDPRRRLQAHIAGKGAKYTRGRGPLTMRCLLWCDSHSHALKEELRIKALPKSEKEKLFNIEKLP